MLSEIAGHCPDGGADVTGCARWYHAWDTRPLPLLEQARRLLATGGLLVSVEQDSHEFGIGAWGRMLDRTRSRVPGGPTLTVRTDESKPVKIRHNSRRPGSRPRSLAGKILEIALTPGVAADGGAAMPAGGGGRAVP